MRIYFIVTNDLSYDQRMIRIATTLTQAGYTIKLVGRKLNNSIPILAYLQNSFYHFIVNPFPFFENTIITYRIIMPDANKSSIYFFNFIN